MTSFLKIIRFPNLLIVSLTQLVLEYLVLLPTLQKAAIMPLLDNFHFGLLVFTTIIIAAAGYITNDIEDYELDIINKPQKVIIGNGITKKSAIRYYWILVVIGFLLAIYLALHINNFKLVLLYPTATLGLWGYSKYLKKKVLSGNIIVSFFVAFVAGIVLFAERDGFSKIGTKEGRFIQTIFGAYLVFAFLANMIREIIKDMEDKEGDALQGCKTLPIVYGNRIAKMTGSFLGVLLLVFLIYALTFLEQTGHLVAFWFAIFTVILPLIFLLYYLQKANQKIDFHRLSLLTKIIMLFGLILLIIY